MAETITLSDTADKADRYISLLPQVQALWQGEPNRVANLANTAAALKQSFPWLWVGFYEVQGETLVLGPFQGPVACTRIARGKGVCGTAWHEDRTLVVPDVDAFPGHIACSSESRSEIVVPIHGPSGEVGMVLDVDSANLEAFDATDKEYLEKLCGMISESLPSWT